MKSHISRILVRRRSVHKPRARACGIISIGLCLASFPALRFLFSGGARLLPWGAVFCWIIILMHFAFLAAALWHGLREHPQTVTRKFTDPNYREAEL
jgi:hypothetical protein